MEKILYFKGGFEVVEEALKDVHCDEIDDEQSRLIEVVATRAYENNIGERVTASYTIAMHSYNNAYTYK